MKSPTTRSTASEIEDPIFYWDCRNCRVMIKCRAEGRSAMLVECPECEHPNLIPDTHIAPVYDRWLASLENSKTAKKKANQEEKPR